MHSLVVCVAVTVSACTIYTTRMSFFVRNKKEGTFSSSDRTVGTVPQLSEKNGGRFALIRSTAGGGRAASAPDPTGRRCRAPPARPHVNSLYRRSRFISHTAHPTFSLLVGWRRRHSRFIYLFIFHSSSTDRRG
jgi:hypothetical protein